jgi:hypothetical protein
MPCLYVDWLLAGSCDENRSNATEFNPLNAELNLICHLLALLGAHPIFQVSRIRVDVIKNMTTKFSSALIL